MSNYTKATNFATKDGLPTGSTLKRVKGTEIDDEFNALSVAVATKANINDTVLTGTPVAPTAISSTNTTQLATTEYTTSAIAALPASGITSVFVAAAAASTGHSIYINDIAPVAEGNNGDVWFEY